MTGITLLVAWLFGGLLAFINIFTEGKTLGKIGWALLGLSSTIVIGIALI